MPHTPREFSYFIIIIETLYWATVCRITHIDVHLAKGGKKNSFMQVVLNSIYLHI